MLTFTPKNALFGDFRTEIRKSYCHISNQRPQICLIAKFSAITKILKFGTKNALFRCFGQQFRKTIVIFEISALKFALVQMLVKKWKPLNLGPIMPDLRVLGLEFEDAYLKSAPSNLSNCNISRKNKSV